MAERLATVTVRPPLTEAQARVVALVVTSLVALGDLLIPGNYLLPAIYGVALVACAWVRSYRFLWILTGLLVALTFSTFLIGRPMTQVSAFSVAVTNRCLAAIATLVVAVQVHFWIRTDGELCRHRERLEKQNQALETANQELIDREEEIVRQNEELQSQTEELERQSEELRITNEELASREKTLEQLLELSRSLTAEVPRDEMLKRICESLEVLSNGLASAILEKRGSELHIPCYHGFGPEGIQSKTLPLAHSFASLILSLGQTGYLEDVNLRSDLHIPQPKTGEPFRSVLASPLRIRGQCVGTIEIYASQPQTWTPAQIAMLESLAAQASISLQSAELIEGIRQERRGFEAAFRTVPFGMAVAEDEQGSRIRLNPAAAGLFQLPLDENISLHSAAGLRLARYFFQQDRSLAPEQLPWARALRGEEIQGEVLDVILPNGRRLGLLMSASPIHDALGRIAGAVCGFVDIAPLLQLQRELELRRREAEEASVRKTRFLAAVSHDIRTPVNAINLMAEVIRRCATNPPLLGQIPEMAKRLQANALSLVDLVSDVLDIARFDSGKIELQESEFLLNDLLADECRQLQPLVDDKGLALRMQLPERPIWVRTDRVKLGRVIGNLVGNAIKFTEEGRVEIRAGVDEQGRVVIDVIDTGVGIAGEHLHRIFDEFAQIHNPERDRTKGTGLGLAISRRLVEVMGGTLAVHSSPGTGSTFTVTLPPTALVVRLDVTRTGSILESNVGRTPALARPLAGMRILLVEDHAATRESTAQILRGEGAQVGEAAHGPAALQLLEAETFDVLLLDMMMPGMDGREILKSLQARRPPGLKAVLVLTGDLTQERLDEVQRLGADGLIGKPIEVQQLVATLQTIHRPRPVH